MFDPKTRILILDDMLTMRKIVKKTLKELGFEDVQEAADGNLGWEILEKSNPPIQLVISDWNMPNCTGLELLKRVRMNKNTKGLPFLLLTAESETAQVIEAVKAGVSGYVIKPFTSENLKTKLDEAYKKKAA
jgi:two-component system chemotaxis response regulator CheY